MAQYASEIFYSKRDWWATLMIWGIAIVCWTTGIWLLISAILQEGKLLSGFIAILSGAGTVWFWISTRYKLTDHSLLLFSGPFFKRIMYADIRSVRNGSRERGWSFAFSMDCLQIDVADSRHGFRISPKMKRRFLSALNAHCTHLILNGEELIQKNIL